MAKPNISNIKYIQYTICRQWTGGDVTNCFVSFDVTWEWWRWKRLWKFIVVFLEITFNTCDVFKSFWTSRIILYYCNIPIYKHPPHTAPLHICHSADNSPPRLVPYITQYVTTFNAKGNKTHKQYYFEVVDIGHSYLKNNTTGHRTWEVFLEFCRRKSVIMPSMMSNNYFESWQLHRWSRNSLCL